MRTKPKIRGRCESCGYQDVIAKFISDSEVFVCPRCSMDESGIRVLDTICHCCSQEHHGNCDADMEEDEYTQPQWCVCGPHPELMFGDGGINDGTDAWQQAANRRAP